MAKANKAIIEELLDIIVRIVSEGSSYQYILMVLSKFVQSHIEEFPFAAHIHIDLHGIKVGEEINSADPQLVGKFLKVMINTLFSDLFMHLVSRKLPKGLIEDLEYLGVEIKDSKKV